jgi:hypothetical protein
MFDSLATRIVRTGYSALVLGALLWFIACTNDALGLMAFSGSLMSLGVLLAVLGFHALAVRALGAEKRAEGRLAGPV